MEGISECLELISKTGGRKSWIHLFEAWRIEDAMVCDCDTVHQRLSRY